MPVIERRWREREAKYLLRENGEFNFAQEELEVKVRHTGKCPVCKRHDLRSQDLN